MKKLLSLLLVLSMTAVLLAGCHKQPSKPVNPDTDDPGQETKDPVIDPGNKEDPTDPTQDPDPTDDPKDDPADDPVEDSGLLSDFRLAYQRTEQEDVLVYTIELHVFAGDEPEYWLSTEVKNTTNGRIHTNSTMLTPEGRERLSEAWKNTHIDSYYSRWENNSDQLSDYGENAILSGHYEGGKEFFFNLQNKESLAGFYGDFSAFFPVPADLCGYALTGRTEFLPNMGEADTERMSNKMSYAPFCWDKGNNLLGSAYAKGLIAFVRNPHLVSDYSVVQDNCDPIQLSCDPVSGDVYYIDSSREDGLYVFDGIHLNCVLEHVKEYCISEGILYYVSEEDLYLYSYDLTTKESVLLMDEEVNDCYVFEGWLIYQSSTDNYSIHVRNLTTGKDIPLLDEEGRSPVIVGNLMYYWNQYGEICSLDLVNGTKKQYDLWTDRAFLISGDYLYFYNARNESIPCCTKLDYMSTERIPDNPFQTYSYERYSVLRAVRGSDILYSTGDEYGCIFDWYLKENYDGGMTCYFFDVTDGVQ